jgi:hypothetical protein
MFKPLLGGSIAILLFCGTLSAQSACSAELRKELKLAVKDNSVDGSADPGAGLSYATCGVRLNKRL